MKKGILLDLDGTLWDSSDNVAKAWIEALKDENDAPDMDATTIKDLMGFPMDEIGEKIFKGLPEERQFELLKKCENHENAYIEKHGGNLFENVEETFKRLKEDGYFLAIISNCQKGYIEAFLDYYGFNKYMDDFIGYGDNLKQKDENMKLIVKRNGLDQALYVGDIENDYIASKKAGLPFILAGYGFGKVENVPVIQSFDKLPEAAREIFHD